MQFPNMKNNHLIVPGKYWELSNFLVFGIEIMRTEAFMRSDVRKIRTVNIVLENCLKDVTHVVSIME